MWATAILEALVSVYLPVDAYRFGPQNVKRYTLNVQRLLLQIQNNATLLRLLRTQPPRLLMPIHLCMSHVAMMCLLIQVNAGVIRERSCCKGSNGKGCRHSSARHWAERCPSNLNWSVSDSSLRKPIGERSPNAAVQIEQVNG